MYLESLQKMLSGPEPDIPYPPYPCKCGHGVFDHGSDNRDTSCTECTCVRFKDAPQRAP